MAAPSVVLVGAGRAGSDTAAALRARGFTGAITLVGDEPAVPYHRPPLSKGYLAGTTPGTGLDLLPASFYPAHGIELVRGDAVVELDREGGLLTLDSGRRLGYDRLVLATGARPRMLPLPGADLDGVLTLRGLADAAELRERLREAGRLLVVGGGFLGLELASAAREMGLHVTVVEAGPRVMARSVSEPLSGHLAAQHALHGTRIVTGREVAALHGDSAGHVRVAQLAGGECLPADVVVVGAGVLPNTRLAAAAGLAVGDGVLVDRYLLTSDRAIHAIGDCARFPSRYATGQVRLESVQNAADQARYVAAALCGEAPGRYAAVPWFWTEQCGTTVQIAGITAGHDRTVVAGDPAAGRFSVFCFRGDRLLGTESVNRPADHMITRRLLASDGRCPAPEEVARPGFDLKHHHRQQQPA